MNGQSAGGGRAHGRRVSRGKDRGGGRISAWTVGDECMDGPWVD